ncbi:transcriptional regulator, AraC family [Cnuella takakiae]|uniref:Transcriptional regulator, AraC family n=1 Tax=Cnuella takakiae TaxID=1302690 RepID=A0A1M5B736_9BACT|nr:AraC family transcriptional regulator [Cnuella takakiae]OLY93358.1 AraC family transcriptional regulator [Cnuella takakiae]SHF38226.1 transcriptional regulator, AraC family [Cnuella takakiae]
MRLLVEKLPLSENTSFVARTHRTPHFEVPWHQHVEYELILFTEGAGMSFVGNYVGEFEVGDIYFLGANLPHTFQKTGDLVTSAVVVQFKADFWGNAFLELPECRMINKFLKAAAQGFKIQGALKQTLHPIIQQLEHARGFDRVLLLSKCLHLLSENDEHQTLSTQELKPLQLRDQERIDRIFQHTMEHYREPITLEEIGAVAGMSIPAFCAYFKKRTKKTYIDFVNEMRIGYACTLLADTEQSIMQVSFDSGFNSVAHFNKQFLKIKGITPSKFRKAFTTSAFA